ncbi:hypothetical protein [Salinibaculum rarum]|uniref:hypothetical protein n=1 Tax=Salinibaculum rarum TaxID=3058903 RepID=UPI00265EB364|nr:hypothetical protein [Salinibaculum sp. KK48]
MTDRVQLGWRIPHDAWDRFTDYVAEKHAADNLYIRVELETAMLEYLDNDGILQDAEQLLRDRVDGSPLSSSPTTLATTRYQDGNTRLVTHRIRKDLKEEFKAFAKQHNAESFGRLLANALDAYAEGGRARRILDDLTRIFDTDTTTDATPTAGSTTDSVENTPNSTQKPPSSTADSGSSDQRIESSLSTASASATTTERTPDPITVTDAVNILLDDFGADSPADVKTFHRKELESTIKQATGSGDQDTFELYHDPVLDQINAGSHPHIDGMYITDWAREEKTLWADLDKAERLILLRRWAVAEAIENGEQKRAFTYRDVTELFESRVRAGPSHQYAYDLMEAAADEPGFNYGEYSIGTQSARKQLRVDVSEVDDNILAWVEDECDLDPSRIGVIADVTSYTAGSPPNTDAAADD